jgi:phenylpyruvate tautomerase PptA (4-oxalocrotonate tautomerase family)
VPILEVVIVGAVDPHREPGLAAALADAAALALSSSPRGTWVIVTRVPRGDYAEGGGGPEPGVEPVFVKLLMRAPPTGQALAEQAAVLTRALAECIGRPPAYVHVRYEPPGSGRQAFGGGLVD